MEIENKTILITGGSGFIGSHLCKKFSKKASRIIIFSRGTDRNSVRNLLKYKNVKFVGGDIKEKKDIDKAIDSSDIIIHLAAYTNIRESIKKPLKDLSTTIGTINLLQSMVDIGLEKLIYVSAARVYGIPKYIPVNEEHPLNPNEPYGIGKMIGEQYCNFHKRYGIKPMILRLHSVYGPGQLPKKGSTTGVISIFVNELLKNKDIIIYGDGSIRRDFLHIKDFINIVELLIKKDCWNYTFNVGSGKATTIKELADILMNEIKPTKSSIIYKKELSGETDNFPDISLLLRKTGYVPKINLLDGIRDYINWVKNKNLND